ncbi:hypothetical protein [Nonomuraea basaltis]|uniref:hypothetical protein n=1 Tax=Nonomuraea basaltis TaxID=2495887 RepID=UPI00110C64A1|nr:hypothetical protein [Nonomuraea basaltis]TMR94349.1 hypothetical protein EJK15_34310 [Nonomuraea basaltis]
MLLSAALGFSLTTPGIAHAATSDAAKKIAASATADGKAGPSKVLSYCPDGAPPAGYRHQSSYWGNDDACARCWLEADIWAQQGYSGYCWDVVPGAVVALYLRP